jgi:hypothetical protein
MNSRKPRHKDARSHKSNEAAQQSVPIAARDEIESGQSDERAHREAAGK